MAAVKRCAKRRATSLATVGLLLLAGFSAVTVVGALPGSSASSSLTSWKPSHTHSDAALRPLQSTMSELAVTDAHLAAVEQRIHKDRQRLARDAVNAYVNAIPQDQTASLFGGSAAKADASSEYANAVAGNFSADEAALNAQLYQLNATEGQRLSQERQASAAAHQTQALGSRNAAQTAAPTFARADTGRP